MARRLNATDAYLIMRNLVKQATGQESTLQTNDLSALVRFWLECKMLQQTLWKQLRSSSKS